MNHTHHKTNEKTLYEYFLLSFITLAAAVAFVYVFQGYHSLQTKAQENTIALKIKLQGETHPLETVKVNITLYKSLGKVKEFNNVVFVSQLDKRFEGTITLDSDFDYNSLYAIYVKPQKYFGKLFCSATVVGKDCTSPQFIFLQRGYIVDLSTNTFFSGGDVDPQNGRVDAYDISKIISNLGKSDLATDINNDGTTSTFDYLLALYSLDKNITDDIFSLMVPWAPTATITPPPLTPTFPFPQNSPIPTLYPNLTITPLPTNTGIPAPMGDCQIIPTAYGKNTCHITNQYLSATIGFTGCASVYSSTTKCEYLRLNRKCTCPLHKICTCQMKNQINQKIKCSNGGELDIVGCN